MKKNVSLSVGRGEKLPVSKGAGLTAKGREKYNRETGSNLKAPAPNPKTKADQGRKDSFCARMGAVAATPKMANALKQPLNDGSVDHGYQTRTLCKYSRKTSTDSRWL
jgi:hypothetical protein